MSRKLAMVFGVSEASENSQPKSDPLKDLAAACESAKAAHRRVTQAVFDARQQGISWARIGETVGMSRQGAHDRWGADPDQACEEPDCMRRHGIEPEPDAPCGCGRPRRHARRRQSA